MTPRLFYTGKKNAGRSLPYYEEHSLPAASLFLNPFLCLP